MTYERISTRFNLIFCLQIDEPPVISDDGHPEHMIAGAIIGGTVSYLVFRKTNNKLKAWLIGAASATAVGYLKELVDPELFNGVRSDKDFGYSALGGIIGASIVIPLLSRRPKKHLIFLWPLAKIKNWP